MEEFRTVALSDCYESPLNTRRHFDEAALNDLTESVASKGVLTPLLVRAAPRTHGTFEILAGARRCRAARAAGLTQVPVRVCSFDDDEALEVVCIENLQREDVHPLEEAEGYKALLDRPGYDVAGVAAKVGKPASYVHGRLKLTDLIEPAREAFLADKLLLGHALLIARLQPADQEKAIGLAFRDDYSNGKPEKVAVRVSDLAERIEQELLLDLRKALFDAADADLLPEAGSCTICPKRTGANPSLFGDIEKGDTCTDGACFQAKINAHLAAKAADLAAKGPEPLRLATTFSIKDGNKGGVLTSRKWARAKPKECPAVQKGIVVHTDGYGELKVGQVVTACADLTCKVHHRKRPSSGGSSHDDWQKKDEARRAKEEAVRARRAAINHRLFVEIFTRTPKTLGKPDLVRLVIDSVRDRDAHYLAPLIGIEIGEPLKRDDWKRREKLATDVHEQLASLTEGDLFRLLGVVHLIDGIDPFNDDPEIPKTAKAHGIDVKAITKAVDDELAATLAATKAPAGTKCEVCACTEQKACEGGCAWDPTFQKKGRWVCTTPACVKSATARGARKPKKAAPAKATRAKKAKKAKAG